MHKQKKRLAYICVMMVSAVLSFQTAFAHSGRTDAQGGHWNRKEGTYHYHNSGYTPAKQSTPAPAPAPVPEPTPVPTAAPVLIKVYVNDEQVIFEQSPELVNDRLLVPIRPIVEKLGCNVFWDADTQTSYINDPDTELVYANNESDDIKVYVNNERIIFPDQQPANLHDYIYVPARYVVEKLGCTADWDGGRHSLFINQKH